ncbi:PCRF domain-containing protein [Ditylenchus destructor]|uniref:PCRF domain-containing protein n=1 Tax=Ditylenchus destructor TaxID=166010 RepID=A0AAD4R7F5_9BILA|nr:PCRF domain-containing protein [Ditylenchus destructor]
MPLLHSPISKRLSLIRRIFLQCQTACISTLTDVESLNNCQMEIERGTGGAEASLFANDLYRMYENYITNRGWRWQPIEVDRSDIGGLRSAIIGIQGENCYSLLRFEAGTHRVQRCPLTDKTRIHTSTASIAVLPEPEEPESIINLNKNDIKIEAMRSSGAGGQNVNKKLTACRVTHLPTGLAVKAMDERFYHLNLKIAYQRLSAILLQRMVEAGDWTFSSVRKLQIGSRARHEKIRTYSYKDNRVTDHRLKFFTPHLHDFLSGGESLDDMLNRLQEMHVMEVLEEEQQRALAATKENASAGKQ